MSPLPASRRSFLHALSVIPGLGALAPAALSAAPPASGGRDVIQELGLRTFINAAGTYTFLTASLMPPEVMAAMQVASRQYVPLMDLHNAVGEKIAKLLHCEAALVTTGCASALSLGTAACVAGSDAEKIRRIPDTSGMKNEVIVQKSHRNGYDHAVRNAGVRLIEVETPKEMEQAINSRTAMMFFLNAANPRGQVHYEQFVNIGKMHNVPTMIDAAADVPPAENLWRFTKLGFDLVAFSGGKGLLGPQSAGLLLSRKDLIEAAKLNDSPNSDSLCRTNKVNKEEIVGMLVALELFLDRDHEATWKEWERRCRHVAGQVADIPSVRTDIFVPQIANAVPHLRINWDPKLRGLTPSDVAVRLREGKPSIEARPGSSNSLTIAVWMMQPGDAEIVGGRVREILAS